MEVGHNNFDINYMFHAFICYVKPHIIRQHSPNCITCLNTCRLSLCHSLHLCSFQCSKESLKDVKYCQLSMRHIFLAWTVMHVMKWQSLTLFFRFDYRCVHVMKIQCLVHCKFELLCIWCDIDHGLTFSTLIPMHSDIYSVESPWYTL